MSQERKNNRPDPDSRDLTTNRLEQNSSTPNDLPDSEEDRKKLEPTETYIDLPDVKDIPGQEFVHVPPAGELGDTTISSDDEEGTSVFDREDRDDLRRGTEGDVSREERRTLEQVDYLPTRDENNLITARMDNVDFQNEPLNERSFGDERSGRDLDVPGGAEQPESGARSDSDEENKFYSLGSDDNDNASEGTP